MSVYSKQTHEVGYFESIKWQQCNVDRNTKKIKSLLSAVTAIIDNNSNM